MPHFFILAISPSSETQSLINRFSWRQLYNQLPGRVATTEVLLPLLDSDLFEVALGCAEGNLKARVPEAAACETIEDCLCIPEKKLQACHMVCLESKWLWSDPDLAMFELEKNLVCHFFLSLPVSGKMEVWCCCHGGLCSQGLSWLLSQGFLGRWSLSFIFYSWGDK